MFGSTKIIVLCFFLNVLSHRTVHSASLEKPEINDIEKSFFSLDLFHDLIGRHLQIMKQSNGTIEEKDQNTFSHNSQGLTSFIEKIIRQSKEIVKKAVDNLEKPIKIAYREAKEIFYSCINSDFANKILVTHIEPLKKLMDKLHADAQEILHDAPGSMLECYNMVKLEKTPGLHHLSNCSHDESVIGSLWNLVPKYEEKIAELFKTMNYDFNDFVLPIFENCFTDAYLTAKNFDTLSES